MGESPDFSAASFTSIFPSYLFAHDWPQSDDLNRSLRQAILAEEQCNPGRAKSNVGGWHSAQSQLEFCGEAGAILLRRMYQMGDEATQRVFRVNGQVFRPPRWSLDVWANVNREGDFNRTHTHPGSTWSGTYYVTTGDPAPDNAEGTPLHLLDPCQGRANSFFPSQIATNMLITPRPGLMVLFPSYVPHTVFSHRGTGARISIAFNLRKEPFP